MAITLATGTVVAIASAYAVSKNITAITNDNPAVATFEASHGLIVGDYVEITSGWDRLSGRIVRISAVNTNDLTLEGIDTSDTDVYPTGSGTGSGREISTWTNLSQITAGITVSGGEINFADVTTLADTTQKQIPTTRSPMQVSLPLFDDPSLSWYSTVNGVSESRAATGMRMSFPNGSKLVANAYWSLQTVPTIEDSTLRGRIDLSFAAEPVRYST